MHNGELNELKKSFDKSVISNENVKMLLKNAIFYKNGSNGYNRNLQESILIYKDIIKLYDNADAYNNLACIYIEGKWIDCDLPLAFEYLSRAADKGLIEAVNNLGVLYFKGLGIEQNYEKAFECFLKAEKLGNKQALFHIGYCYQTGLGVEKNLIKACEFYKEAIKHGINEAYLALSLFYKFGFGDLKIEKEKSEEFFNKALSDNSFFIDFPNQIKQKNNLFALDLNQDPKPTELAICDNRIMMLLTRMSNLLPNIDANTFAPFINHENLPVIFKAAFKGDLDVFNECLEQQKKENKETLFDLLPNGKSLLIIAILGHNEHIVKRLFEINFSANYGYFKAFDCIFSPLSLAMIIGHAKIIKILTAANAKIEPHVKFLNESEQDNMQEEFNKSKNSLNLSSINILHKLIFAIKTQNEYFVNFLLNQNIPINSSTKDGITFTMLAATIGNVRILRMIIDAGCKINYFDIKNTSAVMYACKHGNPGCLAELLNNKNLDHSGILENFDETNYTAIGYVIEKNDMELFNIFMQNKHYANPEIAAKYNKETCLLPNTDEYRKLKSVNQQITSNDKPLEVYLGTSLLRLAVEKNNINVIKQILPNIENFNNSNYKPLILTNNEPERKNALMVACENGNLEIVRLLLTRFSINAQCRLGKTALHYAIDNFQAEHSYEIVKLLLEHGIKFNTKDNRNFTPLIYISLQREKYYHFSSSKNEKHIELLKYIKANKIFGLLLTEKIKERINLMIQNGKLKIKLNEAQIFGLATNLHFSILFLNPKISEKETILISLIYFQESIIPRDIRKKINKNLKLRNNVLDNIILKIIGLYENDIRSGQLFNIDYDNFLKLIWENSFENKNYQSILLNRKNILEQQKLKQKKDNIESDLFWFPEKLKKYINETLKLSSSRLQAKEMIEKMQIINEALDANLKKFGIEKLNEAEKILGEITAISNKLLEQELSMNIAFKRLEPKIKALLKENNFKEAEKLFKRLYRIKERIENLGKDFKDLLKRLKEIGEKLDDKILQHKIYIDNQHKRLQRKSNKEKTYIEKCIEKLTEAEDKLKQLEIESIERLKNKQKNGLKPKIYSKKTQKQLKVSQKFSGQLQKQNRLISEESEENEIQVSLRIQRDKEIKKIIDQHKQKNENSNKNPMVQFMAYVVEQNQELQVLQKQLTNLEINNVQSNKDSLSLAMKSNDVGYNDYDYSNKYSSDNHQKVKTLTFGAFNIESQLKARDELNQLQSILQEIIFNDCVSKLDIVKNEIYFKLERACIMGIVARAMECYKNIPGNNFSSVRRKNNFLKIIARTFRDAAFHCFDEKLFKQPNEDLKKNSEINRPFIDMACKLLTILNDPKWQKQFMTKDDILEAFNGKSKENDLFTKIYNLKPMQNPSALECKEQILLGRREIKEFENIKEIVPECMFNAAIGFCEARIGCFASELINYPVQKQEDKIYRQTFNSLRFEYKIPLGQYIQKGIAFRHVLKTSLKDNSKKEHTI